MQAWEEKAIEREEALKEGRAEGRVEGENSKLKAQVMKKIAKGLDATEIADMLEEDVSVVERMMKEIKTEE